MQVSNALHELYCTHPISVESIDDVTVTECVDFYEDFIFVHIIWCSKIAYTRLGTLMALPFAIFIG